MDQGLSQPGPEVKAALANMTPLSHLSYRRSAHSHERNHKEARGAIVVQAIKLHCSITLTVTKANYLDKESTLVSQALKPESNWYWPVRITKELSSLEK